MDADLVADLELAFLDQLRDSHRAARRLGETLGRNPRAFADLVLTLYQPEKTAEPEVAGDAERARKATNAGEILTSWRAFPGHDLPAADREKALEAWAREVLAIVGAAGRASMGQYEVGHVLARPMAEDGSWPCLAARELLESGLYPDLSSGLESAALNARGTVVREPFEGGKQEREIAERHTRLAERIQSEASPRTAALLRKLAAFYSTRADREDAASRAERLEAGRDVEDDR